MSKDTQSISGQNHFKILNSKEPTDKNFIYAMLTPATIVFIIGIAFPLLMAFYISLTNSTISNYFVFPPELTDLFGNFNKFLSPNELYTSRFFQYFYQTLFFVVISVSLELILGMIFALIVNKKFKGRGLTRAALLIPWALPTIVSALVFREIFAPSDTFGLMNEILKFFGFRPVIFYGDVAFNVGNFLLPVPIASFPFFTFKKFVFSYGMITLLIIEVWKTTPFIALLILAALQTVPNDLYKAADIEGATGFQKFRYITLPLIKGPVLIAVLFRLIDAIRIYDSVITLRDQTVNSITVIAVDTWITGDFGISAAIAIMELLMLIFFAILIFKMDKNRLLFAFASFIFLFDRLVSLTVELIQLFTNNSIFLWIFLILILGFVFRKNVQRIFSYNFKFLSEFSGLTNKAVSILTVILYFIGILLLFSILINIYDLILSQNIIFLIIFYVLIVILAFYKFHPKLKSKTEKIFVSASLIVLTVVLIFVLINQFYFSNDPPNLLKNILLNTNFIINPALILTLIFLFLLEFFLVYLINKLKRVNDVKFTDQNLSKSFYFSFCILIIIQIYPVLLEVISYFGIPIPGILVNYFAIQESLDIIDKIEIFSLVIAFCTTINLLVYWYIMSYNSHITEKDQNDHDIAFYFPIVLIQEIILFVMLQNSILIFISLNVIIIIFLGYFFKQKVKFFKNALKNNNLKYLLVFELFLTIELLIFFLEDSSFLLFFNFLVIFLGIIFFGTKKESNNFLSNKFIITSSKSSIMRKKRINDIGFFFLVALMLLFILGPFLWMINRSFRNPCRFAGPETDGSQYCFTAGPSQNSFELSPFLNLIPFFNLDPNAFSLQGYDIVINSQTSNLGQALVNGFILSGLTAIIVVIIGSLVAVVLSKYHFRGENYIVLIIFSMSSLPPIIILIPYYIQISILKGFGIDIFGFENPFYSPANGHFLSLLLPYVAFNFPLGVFLIRSFFTNIPDDLIKAAKVDGASNFQIFRKILIPLTRPGIFTTALMVFIQAWNELLFARLFLLGENDSQTVPLALLKFLLNPSALTGVPWIPELILATGSVIATVPLIILVLILQRYIIAGITSGAVKG